MEPSRGGRSGAVARGPQRSRRGGPQRPKRRKHGCPDRVRRFLSNRHAIFPEPAVFCIRKHIGLLLIHSLAFLAGFLCIFHKKPVFFSASNRAFSFCIVFKRVIQSRHQGSFDAIGEPDRRSGFFSGSGTAAVRRWIWRKACIPPTSSAILPVPTGQKWDRPSCPALTAARRPCRWHPARETLPHSDFKI